MMKLEELVVAGGMIAMLATLLYSAFDTPGLPLGGSTAPLAAASLYPAATLGVMPGFAPNQAGVGQDAVAIPDPPSAPTGVMAAYVAPDIRLAEAHWQGLEVIPLTMERKQKLGLSAGLTGILIDEVTLVAAASGLLAGDVMVAVNDQPVLTLEDFVQATKQVKSRNRAVLTVDRKNMRMDMRLTSDGELGFAQAETAPMIPPGSIAPHPYRGDCVQCHAIGQTGHIRPDMDGVILPPPPIMAKAVSPHRDRGPCVACHEIVN